MTPGPARSEHGARLSHAPATPTRQASLSRALPSIATIGCGEALESIVQVREPAQRRDAGQKAILAASRDDEALYPVEAPADRPRRNGKAAGPVVVADDD